jgi:TolB protein
MINRTKVINWSYLVVLISITGCTLPSQTLFKPVITPSDIEFPTSVFSSTNELIPTSTLNPEMVPSGKIVFTCQVSGTMYQDQICIINANGRGIKQLTFDEKSEHFYPSMAPDGNSAVYSANPTGVYELYEVDLQGIPRQLTHGLGTLTAPEISPDGQSLVFTLGNGQDTSIWMTDRTGNNPRVVYGPGWDPTWSPDGSKIMFATYDVNKSIQLSIINKDGSDLKQITHMENLRGRSDWSPDGKWAVTYAGEPWQRELFLIPMDGGDPVQLTPTGGNSQGPSFSPDGQWVAFTAYYNDIGNDDGCEIYIIKVDGTQLTRLTDNSYCSWQPRWGP